MPVVSPTFHAGRMLIFQFQQQKLTSTKTRKVDINMLSVDRFTKNNFKQDFMIISYFARKICIKQKTRR